MKKAKIMLTTIAALAIAGGALAFKLRTDSNVWCKINIDTPQQVCLKMAYNTYFSGSAPTTTNPCPEETVFYTDNQCQAANTKIETLNTVYQTDL